jgi:hypothetical protein
MLGAKLCHGCEIPSTHLPIPGEILHQKMNEMTLPDAPPMKQPDKTNWNNGIGGESLEGCDWCVLIHRINGSSPNLHFEVRYGLGDLGFFRIWTP